MINVSSTILKAQKNHIATINGLCTRARVQITLCVAKKTVDAIMALEPERMVCHGTATKKNNRDRTLQYSFIWNCIHKRLCYMQEDDDQNCNKFLTFNGLLETNH